MKGVGGTIAREGTDAKLAHEHWAGAWKVTAVEVPGLSYQATLSGRIIRRRTGWADNAKLVCPRPKHLRCANEGEFAHLTWGVD